MNLFETAMNKIRAASILTLVLAAGAWRATPISSLGWHGDIAGHRPAGIRCRANDPLLPRSDGAPFWSATPKNDAQGRAYLPVYDDAEPTFDPPAAASPLTRSKASARFSTTAIRWDCPTPRRCRRRTRWGWTTSPSMTATSRATASTIKVSLDRVQRSGVRTEPVEARVLVRAGARGRHRRASTSAAAPS